MKQISFIILVLAFAFPALSQDSMAVKQAIQALDKAMVSKDTAVFNLYLDKKLSYGHSNGWVQSKDEVRNDFVSGRLSYQQFESSNVRMVSIDKELATAVMTMKSEGIVDGKTFSLNLHVMQVWKKDKKGWQLLARQGAKIN